jgi:hypothetical protein
MSVERTAGMDPIKTVLCELRGILGFEICFFRSELSLFYFWKQSSLNSVINDAAMASKDAI